MNSIAVSTKKLDEADNTKDKADVRYDKRFVMLSGQPRKKEKLSDFVRRIVKEKGFSYRKVAEQSGGRISSTTVGDVINEKVNTVEIETLIGLAKGLKIPEDEIFRVASGKPLQPMTPRTFAEALEALGVTEFAAFSETLTPDEMEEVIDVIRGTLEAKRKRKQKR